MILAVYTPNNDAAISGKEDFFSYMTRVLEKTGHCRKIFVMGDLNSRTGSKLNDAVVRRYKENTINDNSEKVIELCEQHALKITNGWYEHKNIHKYMWTQPTHNLRSIVDYIIVRQQSKLKILDVGFMHGRECVLAIIY